MSKCIFESHFHAFLNFEIDLHKSADLNIIIIIICRAAVKHRSNKISHPKPAKSPGAVKSQRSPAAAPAASPAGRVGVGLRSV